VTSRSRKLEAAGHTVRVSDLYAVRWKSEIDRSDFLSLAADEGLIPVAASKHAFDSNKLTDDVKAEIGKLL
jgi:NAD(P)H dehydrogenase (quinone)